MPIQLREKSQCQYDLIALGEIMLRFDPCKGRIRTAREFKVWNLAEFELVQV
jgi:2-dehydro-3-deoxygluconokinase